MLFLFFFKQQTNKQTKTMMWVNRSFLQTLNLRLFLRSRVLSGTITKEIENQLHQAQQNGPAHGSAPPADCSSPPPCALRGPHSLRLSAEVLLVVEVYNEILRSSSWPVLPVLATNRRLHLQVSCILCPVHLGLT